MTERFKTNLEITGKNPSALERYANLVGINESRYPNPEEFPEMMRLTPEMIGSFFNSIRNTNLDSNERMQDIFWGKNSFKQGKVYIGSNSRVPVSKSDTLKHGMQTFFGKKPWLTYHTHPKLSESDFKNPVSIPHRSSADFSRSDIVYVRAKPRSGLIFGVGQNEGGAFLFQTSKTKQLPFSTGMIAIEDMIGNTFDMVFLLGDTLARKTYTKKILENPSQYFFDKETNTYGIRKNGKELLRKYGYVGYVWDPPQLEYVDPNFGILLKRVF